MENIIDNDDGVQTVEGAALQKLPMSVPSHQIVKSIGVSACDGLKDELNDDIDALLPPFKTVS